MKREVKPPKTFAKEFRFQRSQVEAKRSVTKQDKTLHEIEVKLKFKFITLVMLQNFDEWRSCVELALPIR